MNWLHCCLVLYMSVSCCVLLVLGILCGDCRENMGVTVLFNKCDTCSTASVLWIVVLGEHVQDQYYRVNFIFLAHTVVIIVGIFIFIILLDKPVLEWVLPFLFYIQVRCKADTLVPCTVTADHVCFRMLPMLLNTSLKHLMWWGNM